MIVVVTIIKRKYINYRKIIIKGSKTIYIMLRILI